MRSWTNLHQYNHRFQMVDRDIEPNSTFDLLLGQNREDGGHRESTTTSHLPWLETKVPNQEHASSVLAFYLSLSRNYPRLITTSLVLTPQRNCICKWWLSPFSFSLVRSSELAIHVKPAHTDKEPGPRMESYAVPYNVVQPTKMI